MVDEPEKVEEAPEAGVEKVSQVELLQKALEEEKARSERYLNNWRRAEADFDNYKKRADQERSENTRFANVALILNLLPIIDDLERALSSLPASLVGLTWVDGIGLIERKMQAILETKGVTQIKTVGEQFDPAFHEAVVQVEGEEGKVIGELQKGYRLYDRVIRPALVTVGKGVEKKPKDEKEEQSEKDTGGAGD